MKLIALALTTFIGSLALAQAAPTVKSWNASNITWQNVDPDGTKHAILEGNKDTPGSLFTYALFAPAGSWDDHTHSHNQDARLAVISGALLLAVGPDPDKRGAKSYPAGSFVFVPANVEHTMGADVDTIIIGTAEGPWKTHDNEAPHHH